MDARAFKLVSKLLKYPSIAEGDLKEQMKMSRRQIDYTLREVNDLLESSQRDPIRISRDGHFEMENESAKFLLAMLNDPDSKIPVLVSKEERVMIIIAYMIGCRGYISLNQMAEVLLVSKNTVTSDIKQANVFLDSYHIKILFSRKSGFTMEGDELDIRRVCIVVSYELIRVYSINQIFAVFDFYDKGMEEQIACLERTLGISLTDDCYHALVISLTLTVSRIMQGKYVPVLRDIFWGNEMDGIIGKIQENRCIPGFDRFPVQEKKWIAVTVLASNVTKGGDILHHRTLKHATVKMVRLIEEKIAVRFRHWDEFIDNLLMHIYPACIRMKLKVGCCHIDMGIVKEKYSELFQIVAMSLEPIETLIGMKMPEDEISLITIHIGGELLRQGIRVPGRKRAVIVCANGISISKLLRNSLVDLFSDLNFTDTISYRDFQNYKEDYDLVFTTIPLTSEKPVFLLDSILTDSKKKVLKERVEEEIKLNGSSQKKVEDILSVIQKYGEIYDMGNVRSELKQILDAPGYSENFYTDSSSLPGLTDYIREEFIQSAAQVDHWRTAIRTACFPLYENGIITMDYVEKLVCDFEENGKYYILNNRIMIPHLAPEHGVIRDGFGMLVLKRPVAVWNAPVNFVIPLAVRNPAKHLRAMMQIAEFADDEPLMEKVLKSSTSKEAYDLLKERFG